MPVTVEQRDDAVAVVTIDRPAALNALDRETLTELRDRLRGVATDTGVHALDQVVHFDTEVHRPLSAWVRG